MLETVVFFEEQIKQCRDLAAQSTNKNDREFWLRMLNRWEALLQARQRDRGPGFETAHKFRFQRLRFAKRHAA